jgi:hypothetical protein
VFKAVATLDCQPSYIVLLVLLATRHEYTSVA